MALREIGEAQDPPVSMQAIHKTLNKALAAMLLELFEQVRLMELMRLDELQTGAAQAKIDATLSRLDSVLDQQLRRAEAVEARLDAERDAARAQRMRDNFEQRRVIAQTYDDAFRSFGTTVPEAADDEPAGAYRRRLFNRLARKLAADHELASVRADDVSGQAVVFDNFERMLIDAAKAEGASPSIGNLPPNGEMVARHRTDDMGSRITEFFGRESFIAQMGRPGRRVAKIVNPQTGAILYGRPFDVQPTFSR